MRRIPFPRFVVGSVPCLALTVSAGIGATVASSAARVTDAVPGPITNVCSLLPVSLIDQQLHRTYSRNALSSGWSARARTKLGGEENALYTVDHSYRETAAASCGWSTAQSAAGAGFFLDVFAVRVARSVAVRAADSAPGATHRTFSTVAGLGDWGAFAYSQGSSQLLVGVGHDLLSVYVTASSGPSARSQCIVFARRILERVS